MTAQLTVDDAIRLGTEHFQAGRLADAERFFRLVFTVDPGHPVANHALGLIALSIGRHDDAAGLIGTALQRMPEEPGFLNSLGEVHRISQRHLEALACYERAISLDPACAEALSNRAITLHALGRSDDALASCDAAVAARPQLAAAWSNRGVILETLGRVDEALASLDKALELLPGFLDAIGNRGSILRDLGRLDEALAAFDRVLAARPASISALDGRGSVLQRLLRMDEALASYREALRLNPDFALSHAHEAIGLLLTGEYIDGWNKYEYRSKAHASLARDFKQPAWRGDGRIAGKTVLLHAEQGLGDTLHFARYVSLVAAKKAKVILEVQAPLKPLLRGIGATRVIERGEELPEFDLHCALPSLPLAFGTTLETIPSKVPYLSIEKQAVTTWRRKLARKGTKLVGLCWKGGPVYTSDRERSDRDRSIGLANLQPLLDLPRVRFVSLQKELSEEEHTFVRDRDNFGHAGASFKDTAEMMGALDLVITVDTAWAHWAGAIGKPVWVMLAHYPHWCWLLERQDSPWYPTARLFRQARAGEWDPVLAKVKRGLEAFAGGPESPSAGRRPRPRA